MTQIYLDTASVQDIKKFLSWGIGDGVTTNQSIFLNTAKGKDFKTQSKEILELVHPRPVSLEGPNDLDKLIMEAEELDSWNDNVVIKVPMMGDGSGLEAVKILRRKYILTNVTACMTINQAFLAASAGATYVSLFYNRMIDWKYEELTKENPTNDINNKNQARAYAHATIGQTMRMLEEGEFDTELIVGSIRNVLDIEEILTLHPHIITIPTAILEKMPFNSKTEQTLKDFEKAWEEFNK